MKCKACEEKDSHLAGCPIGEDEVCDMPPIEDVKPTMVCGYCGKEKCICEYDGDHIKGE